MAKKPKPTTRLRAVIGLSYPVGESLKRVMEVGGLRNLTPEESASLTMRRVIPGGWCDDIPMEPRAAFLRAGKIEEVTVKTRTRKVGG